jgi:hypothetical protein
MSITGVLGRGPVTDVASPYDPMTNMERGNIREWHAIEHVSDALQVSFTPPTVRLRGMGTGISEASKRVPIFSCYPGRQASELPFSTEELGPSPRGSDPVSCRLT